MALFVLCICIYFVPFIWNFVLHFVQFCVFCIQNTSFTFCSFFQDTMPEWPPLILDQANNLLVRNIHVNDPNTRMFCIFILFPRWQTRPRPTLAFEDCPCRSGRLRLCIARRNPSRTTRVEKYLRSSNCWQKLERFCISLSKEVC